MAVHQLSGRMAWKRGTPVGSGYPFLGEHAARKSAAAPPLAKRGTSPLPATADRSEEEEEPCGAAAAMMAALKRVEAPGDFATGGSLPLVLPSLELALPGGGVGESGCGGVVGLPLSAPAAEALRTACELAPFGRREETLRDPAVRHTWQLDPKALRLRNPAWQGVVDQGA